MDSENSNIPESTAPKPKSATAVSHFSNNDNSNSTNRSKCDHGDHNRYLHNHDHGSGSGSADHHIEDDDDEETVHFKKIIDAFLYYRRHSELKLASKVKSIRSIPASHLSMIPKLRDHIRHVHRCVIANYAFLRAVVSSTGHMFENRSDQSDQLGDQSDQINQNDQSDFPVASDFNMDKLQSTLRQIVRDWSKDGSVERQQCYQPILDRLIALYPCDQRRSIRILVLGAGLGRLAFDVARLGFVCEGNEFSLFMLFVSNFVLNRCHQENEWTIFPYIHQWTNNWTYDDQIRSVQFPDIDPSEMPDGSNFSMTAGDFMDIYRSDKSNWDCVCTVFFVDTAHNVIDYLRIIYDLLKPGGYWLNFGPLLYHFADMEGEISLELPYEEILEVAKKMGFEILMDEKRSNTTYTQNTMSMLQYQYNCAYSLFRKIDKGTDQ